MGVKSLLQQIPGPQFLTVKRLQNMRLAIDGHCILHRCCMFAAKSILIHNDISSTVKYVISYLETLLEFASKRSILIFDGGCLPSKDATMQTRQDNKIFHLAEAKKLLNLGKSPGDHLIKAFSINSSQLSRIQVALQQVFPDLVIFQSPCEADAQLAFLINSNLADAVVTIDSDLLLYGPKYAIFKFDQKTGDIDFFENENIYTQKLQGKDFIYLQKLAVLAGCDYVPNLKGAGWVKIWKVIKETNGNLLQCLTLLGDTKGVTLPDNYISLNHVAFDVLKALLTFRYHVIYDPISQVFRSMYEVSQEDQKLLQIMGNKFFGTENDDQDYCFKFVTGGLQEDLDVKEVQKVLKQFAQDSLNIVHKLPKLPSIFDLLQIQNIHDGVISGEGFSFDLTVYQ
ncbi:Exonuclease family protein [Spironucleus salmonicida]|uniref:Exonuclease family protein n=1 Tax=Spironucleus salmonicida TaxID=348837 RepID=V6LIT7_9EUKA|nr:Exonuclease family protein [Spironucleus salmonicida]|eukprot:EST43641.1 Exonuclease family protein [Spironucleus salmonicida]